MLRLVSQFEGHLHRYRQDSLPISVLALNKVDLLPRELRPGLLKLAEQFNFVRSESFLDGEEEGKEGGEGFRKEQDNGELRNRFAEVFMTSAIKGDGKDKGTEELKKYLIEQAKGSFEPDDSGRAAETTISSLASTVASGKVEGNSAREALALEVVRESVFSRLHKEIPYRSIVKPVSCRVLRDGSVRIEQDILVESVRKKKIVVGKKGNAIGQIGIAARKQLERHIKLPVHLILNVRVDRDLPLR